jgi:site-specific DNA recombinase
VRAAIYSRFSSDLQRAESIEDQERVCLAVATRHGWEIVGTFSDRAMSGASAFRPRYQDMLQAAQAGKFEVRCPSL